MNPTATLNFLLDNKPVQGEPARVQEKSRSQGSEFKSHLQTHLGDHPQKAAGAREAAVQPRKEQEAQQTAKAVERTSRQAEDKVVPASDATASGGETLPLEEEARKFLAALEPDDRKALLEELRSWLGSLSPEELNALKQTLNENPEDLQGLLPEELQQLLAELTASQVDVAAMLSGFGQLVQGLANADIDFSRVAAIQLPSGTAGELKLLADQANNKAAETTAGTIKDAGVKLDATASTDTTRGEQQSGKEDARQQDPRPERFAELVSRLSRADASAVPSVTRGSDSLQQLLQAAGQGLQGVQSSTATQSMARMAAGFSALPMMTQAAAQANAQALSNRISMMNAKNMQVAEMRLDPPSLGSVRVQIRMQGEMASVVFQAPNAHARELLEQSLPHLKQMMEAEGLMLADAQVSEESFAGQDSDARGSAGSFGGQTQGFENTENTTEQIPLLNQPLGLIDYYA